MCGRLRWTPEKVMPCTCKQNEENALFNERLKWSPRCLLLPLHARTLLLSFSLSLRPLVLTVPLRDKWRFFMVSHRLPRRQFFLKSGEINQNWSSRDFELKKEYKGAQLKEKKIANEKWRTTSQRAEMKEIKTKGLLIIKTHQKAF